MTSFTAHHGNGSVGVQFERPDAAAWAAKLDLRPNGTGFVGPCPVCGEGHDRFHVMDGDGRPGLVGCRKCQDDRTWYRDALAAAGFEQNGHAGPARRVMKPAPDQLPGPKPVGSHNAATVELARVLVDNAVHVPAQARHGWRHGLVDAAPASGLRWLDAMALRRLRATVPTGSIGALVAPLGRPVAACQLLYLDGAFGKIGRPDKRTYGPAGARGFVVGAGDVLRVCEGIADALALAVMGGMAVASVGSGGMVKLAMAAVNAAPMRWRKVVLVPDGDDQDAVEKSRSAIGRLGELNLRLGTECEFAVDGSWSPDPAAVWERERLR